MFNAKMVILKTLHLNVNYVIILVKIVVQPLYVLVAKIPILTKIVNANVKIPFTDKVKVNVNNVPTLV